MFPPSVNLGNGSGQSGSSGKGKAVIKLIALFGSVIIIGVIFLARNTSIIAGFLGKSTKAISGNAGGNIVYQAPYNNSLDLNLGLIRDPHISVPLKTTNGYKNTVFLLDSGATISTLPIKTAEEVGVDLSKSKRIALVGFSGSATFAYLDSVKLQLGNQDFDLPVTFVESSDSYILGRKGLFDNFIINFDYDTRTISISRKSGV